jgi:hypothetical protein
MDGAARNGLQDTGYARLGRCDPRLNHACKEGE